MRKVERRQTACRGRGDKGVYNSPISACWRAVGFVCAWGLLCQPCSLDSHRHRAEAEQRTTACWPLLENLKVGGFSLKEKLCTTL